MVGAKCETEIVTVSTIFFFFRMERMNSFCNVSLIDFH